MRALLAFDKFKDAITAHDACNIAAAALREHHPEWQIDLCPLTDGGEGFAQILTESAGGVMHRAEVTGPKGDPTSAAFGLVPFENIPIAAQRRLALPLMPPHATLAVIEMASASGLALLDANARDPWQTSSLGTGELMQKAAALQASAILLGIGGSASNDLGLGALAALGFRFTSGQDATISPPVPASWDQLDRIHGTVAPGFPPVRVACDVTNPLLGPNGCAAIYGPQKGLKPADLPRLEALSRRIAQLLCAHCGAPESIAETPGAGAAGGIAFGLMAATNAQLLSGFALTADWFDLAERIRSADVILTGEGRYDDSSAQGKGPGAIVAMAVAARRPTHVFAGSIPDSLMSPAKLHPITPSGWKLEDALRATPDLLRAAVTKAFAADPRG
jgi:glycerate kinase